MKRTTPDRPLPRGVFAVRDRAGDISAYKVRWRAYDDDRRARQHSKNFSVRAYRGEDAALAAATAYHAELEYLRRRGEQPKADRRRIPTAQMMTVEDLGIEWARRYAFPRLAPKTRKIYAPIWDRRIVPHIGHYRLTELHDDPRILVEFQETLEEEAMPPQMMRKTLFLLQGVLKHGRRWHPDLLPTPCWQGMFDMPSGQRMVLTRPLPPIAVERIRQQLLARQTRDPLSGIRDATIVSLGAYVVAMRPQEILALTWDRVGPKTLAIEEKLSLGQIVAGTKTGKVRPVRLTDHAAKDLEDWRVAFERRYGAVRPDALVFPADDGGPWSDTQQNNFGRRQWRSACKAAAVALRADLQHLDQRDPSWVARARWYDLRSSAISLALHGKWDLHSVAQLSGTTQANLEERYARLIHELGGEAAKDPDAAIAAARTRTAPATS